MAINAVSAEYLAGLEALKSLGLIALTARHEEEFLKDLAAALRKFVDGDAVALSLTEPYVHKLVIATRDGVDLPALGAGSVPAAADEGEAPLPPEGIFWERLDQDPAAPRVTYLAAVVRPLNIVSAYAAALPCHADVCGHLLFGWAGAVQASPEDLRFLRTLAECVGVVTGLFQLQRAHEADPLTGLLNRAGLRRRWEQGLQAPFGALIFADLDDFKRVNDTHGHLAGDEVLRETARIFRNVCGRRSILARYGGDEIVALVPMAGVDEADAIVAALRREFVQRKTDLAEPVPRISLGVAWWPQDGTDLESLIDRADRRMYQRKREQSGNLGDHLPWSFLRRWLAYSADGVLLLDPQMRVVYVNRGYERLTGVPLDECVGRVPEVLAWAAGGERLQQLKEEVAAHGVFLADAAIRLPGGRQGTVCLRLVPVWDDDGLTLGYVALVHEVRRGRARSAAHEKEDEGPRWRGPASPGRKRSAAARSPATDPGSAGRLTAGG